MRFIRTLTLSAVLLGSAAAFAQHADHSDASKTMKEAMMKGMMSMEKMPMSGDTDMDFAMMMKMHHEQALPMAQMELEHGKSPEMKAMAKEILSAQRKEIEEFDQWLAKQK